MDSDLLPGSINDIAVQIDNTLITMTLDYTFSFKPENDLIVENSDTAKIVLEMPEELLMP